MTARGGTIVCVGKRIGVDLGSNGCSAADAGAQTGRVQEQK